MPTRIRPRLSFAHVTSLLALFVALSGGTAYAVVATNQVVSSSIKNGQVKTSDLGGKAVTGSKIANNAVTGAKLLESSLDFSVLQSRITGACGSGQAMASINQNGTVGCVGSGGPPSGAAGGTLAGTYPDPSLDVSGGPCPSGRFLSDLSTQAVLTCGPTGTNTALGNTALDSNTVGTDNTAIGQNALTSNVTDSSNTAVGSTALRDSTGGVGNAAVGAGAMRLNTTGDDNAALGRFAMQFNSTGSGNSAVGEAALASNTTGIHNAALGLSALFSNSTGNENTAVGDGALTNNTASNNSALGAGALYYNTTGARNSALGLNALANNTSADDNTAVGDSALANSAPGSQNTAVGSGALSDNWGFDTFDGDDNTAVGDNALGANTTGSRNTALGINAGSALTTGTDNIDIGNIGVAGENSKIRIGNPFVQQEAFLAGVSGNGVASGASTVMVDTNGQLGTTTSSRRFKEDIRAIGAGSDRLMQLRPVSFHYKRQFREGANTLQYGLIAEEVAKVYPELVAYGHDGKPYTVLYHELPALLLALDQKQQREIRALKARVVRLEAQPAHR